MNLQQAVEYLKAHGKAIGLQAKQGDPKAQTVINFYQIFYTHQEPAAAVLLTAAVEDYRKGAISGNHV